MATSPTPTVSEPGSCGDVFDQLAQSERLLTAKELARFLAISPKTIYSYVERNMIPYYKIEANVRFRAREVAEWLRNRGCLRLDTSGPTGDLLTRLVRRACAAMRRAAIATSLSTSMTGE